MDDLLKTAGWPTVGVEEFPVLVDCEGLELGRKVADTAKADTLLFFVFFNFDFSDFIFSCVDSGTPDSTATLESVFLEPALRRIPIFSTEGEERGVTNGDGRGEENGEDLGVWNGDGPGVGNGDERGVRKRTFLFGPCFSSSASLSLAEI